ncbi:MAG: FAD-binding oxidoreductase [Synergistaceae bacterium]|jgi:glycolate oxidase|nr:FAD-binding oxidoreductase [Synergistaceae bacterium]
MENVMGSSVYSPVSEKVVEDLVALLGRSGVTTDREKCLAYSVDETIPRFEREYAAEAVCFPEDTAQVSAVLRYANEHRIPVTPRGAGTGLSGGAVPACGGIVLSMERMNAILEVDRENRTLTTEPGVVTADVTKAARNSGLFYAGDPCSGDISFIGGNVAENAGGNKVIKYGATGAHVLGLEAVLPDGSVVTFGGRRRKDVTGYDFVHLLVGSEGTLAVVTKIILNLIPLPKRVTDLLVPMPSLEAAVKLVSLVTTEGGVVPSSVEFMDRNSILNVERYTSLRIPHSDAAAQLIIQMDGMDRRQLWGDVEKTGDLCVRNGALEVFVAEDRNARDRVWRIRKYVAAEEWTYSMPVLSKEDIVVPTSAVAAFLTRLPRITERHRATYNAYGHIADGNIHITIFPDGIAPEEDLHELAVPLRRELYACVNDLGGTLSGEHGTGLKRKEYTDIFLNEAQRALMKRVKRAFDPNNILNPSKMLP